MAAARDVHTLYLLGWLRPPGTLLTSTQETGARLRRAPRPDKSFLVT